MDEWMRNVERKEKEEKNKNKWVFPPPMLIILKLGKALEFKKNLYRMLKVNGYIYLDHYL